MSMDTVLVERILSRIDNTFGFGVDRPWVATKLAELRNLGSTNVCFFTVARPLARGVLKFRTSG
jgi:hypothetical protein